MASEPQERTQFDSMEPWLASFANLDKPRTITSSPREVPKFSINLETNKGSTEEKRMRAAIVAEAQKKWPGMDVAAAIREGRLNVPLSDGDKMADKAAQKSADSGKSRLREWSRGKVVLIARSKDEFPPAVTIRENGQTVELESLDAVSRAKAKYLYTGVQVLFGVRLNAYDAVGADGKPGVNAYLEAVESLGTGEKLIAAKDRTERFRGYIGLAKDEDPTGAAAGSGGDW